MHARSARRTLTGKPPVRVLHVLTENVRRGAETSGLLLRDELRDRGFDARAVALTDVDTGPWLDVPVLGPTRLGRRTLAPLRRLGSRADVVIAHGSSTLPACAIALLGLPVPIVYVNIGDLMYWAAAGPRRWRTAALLRRASVVAARSPRSASTLASRFGVPPRKIAVVPNGRPAALFHPVGDDERLRLREHLGCVPGERVVAWVGTLSHEKRPDLAVQAVARVPGSTLLMAGDGPLRDDTERLAAQLAPNRVRLLGMLQDPAPVYAAADVLLLTSDSEGLPGVLIEAALTGVPSVATDVGFVADVLQDGVTGVVVRPGSVESIASGLQTALASADRLGAQAFSRAQAHFSMTAVGDRWERILRDVVPRGRVLRHGQERLEHSR
ncbi:MAG TPA: glycosyltransferase family 4 protein [Actinomycetales bacterium]|nr:glycosyltransferase family 4 protein [Actinomycetales bacterium]